MEYDVVPDIKVCDPMADRNSGDYQSLRAESETQRYRWTADRVPDSDWHRDWLIDGILGNGWKCIDFTGGISCDCVRKYKTDFVYVVQVSVCSRYDRRTDLPRCYKWSIAGCLWKA